VGPTHPYKGGIAQHTTELAHRLVAAGVGVEVWSWRRQYPARLYPGEQRVAGSRPESPPFPATTEPLSWDRPVGWLAAGRRARREGLDAVLLTWTTPVQAPAYAALLAAYLRRGAETRAIGVCHNVLPHEGSRADRPLARSVLGRCAGLFVHSASEAEQARELAPRARVGIAALPPPALPTGSGAAWDGPTRSLLFFGLVRPYKGLDVLLTALAHPDAPRDLRLVVAGEFWTPVAQMRAQVAALGLQDRVDLRPGYVAAGDVAGLFAAADAVVLPYRAGTSSIVPDLAHRHGVPVVVTSVGTLAATVRDGVDGLVVAPEDPAALAGALRRLYTGAELARLRAGVDPPDRNALWGDYVDVLLDLLAAPPLARRR